MAYDYPYAPILLSSQTASSSANLAFTSIINSHFTNYLAIFKSMLPATTNTTFRMEVSSDNGSTWKSTNYRYCVYNIVDTPTGTASGSEPASNSFVATSVSATTTRGFNGYVNFWNMNSGVEFCGNGQIVQYNQSAVFDYAMIQVGNTTTQPITAVRFSFSAGNIASGTINFYGVPFP